MGDIENYYNLKQKPENKIQSFSFTVDWNLDNNGQSYGRSFYGEINTTDNTDIFIENTPPNDKTLIEIRKKTVE